MQDVNNDTGSLYENKNKKTKKNRSCGTLGYKQSAYDPQFPVQFHHSSQRLWGEHLPTDQT